MRQTKRKSQEILRRQIVTQSALCATARRVLQFIEFNFFLLSLCM